MGEEKIPRSHSSRSGNYKIGILVNLLDDLLDGMIKISWLSFSTHLEKKLFFLVKSSFGHQKPMETCRVLSPENMGKPTPQNEGCEFPLLFFYHPIFCPKFPPRIFASAALISVDGLCFAVVAAVARLEGLEETSQPWVVKVQVGIPEPKLGGGNSNIFHFHPET